MLQRVAASRARSARPDWRRLLQTVGQGLTTYGVAAFAHEHRLVAGAVLAHQTRPRRIAVMGATGGVGTTTVAVLLASVLSAARDDQTLLLTVHSDASDAAARLAIPQAPTITDIVAGLRRHGRIPPTPVTPGGVRVVAGPEPGTADLDAGLATLLEVAAEGHACVVIDAGVAARHADLARLGEIVDTLVVVCAITPAGAQATGTVLTRWRTQIAASAVGARLIVVSAGGRACMRARRGESLERLRATGIPAHWMPRDRELARGATIDLSTLTGPALTAMLTLAGDIMGHR